MSSTFASLTGLDLFWTLAAIASTLGAFVSAIVLALFDRRNLVVAFVVLETVTLVLAPAVAWLDMRDMLLRLGMESEALMFFAPALRALTIFATALTIANVAAITAKKN